MDHLRPSLEYIALQRQKKKKKNGSHATEIKDVAFSFIPFGNLMLCSL
jgi:hypothetical protein